MGMKQEVSARRSRQRINLLWVLAAILGAAAIHSAARAIHNPAPSAEIMGHFAEVSAGFAASIAEGRLQALAREAFVPEGRPPGSIHVLELFRFDRAAGALDRSAPVGGTGTLPDSVLRSVAFGPRSTDGSLALHFLSDTGKGQYAILITLRYDSSGTSTGGYGLVTDAGELVGHLFGPKPASIQRPDPRSSLEVATTTGVPLYRTSGPVQPYRATIHPAGTLGDLAITSGLAPPTGMLASFQSISRQQLWLSGLLMLCTAVIIVIAATSSRREALLARARSDFIAGVSHELRMPLAQILLASETLALEREQNSRARLDLATSIVREARRLAAMVDNVLLVARSGAVSLRPTLAPVDVVELFAEVQESVHLAVEDAGQGLEVRAVPGLAALGDLHLLRQALTNLIDNARKYGALGQTIRLGVDQTATEKVRLFVENDGPGVPAELRRRVFEPYERLSRDQTSERTGSGLGLAVVEQIARACGGKVWLEAGRPEGTRAVLELREAPRGNGS